MSGSQRLHQPIITAWVFTFISCLVFCSPDTANAQTAEESTLRTLTERFFDAYQKEDINNLLALWSKASPELAAGEQALRRTFTENDRIRLNDLSILAIKVDGSKAVARVLVNISATDAKTGAPATGLGKMSRALHFVREGGQWKVSRYVSGEEELADELINARTDAERRALLEAQPESVTDELVRELVARRGARLFAQGEFATALDIASLGLAISRRIGYGAGVAGALRLTGNVQTMRGDYAQALDSYQKSLVVGEELGDKRSILGSLNNLGNVYNSMGDQERALDYYQRALAIASEIGNLPLQMLVTNNLGNIYEGRGDHLRSLEYYQRSLKLAEELKDEEAISRAILSIGFVHGSLGNYEQALEFYQRGMANIDRADVPRILINTGITHAKQGNYDLALDYLQKALKAAEDLGDKEVIAGSLKNIGNVYARRGDYEKAFEYIRRGLALGEAIGNKSLVTNALHDLALDYLRLGDYPKAIEYADRAAALALQSDLTESFQSARTVAGQAQIALKRFDLARRSLLEAIATIEKLREQAAGGEQDRERFFESKVDPYYAMVDLSFTQNNNFEALDYGDRAKSRVLAEVLGSGRVDITKAMTVEEQEREKTLNNQLVALNRELYREKTQRQPDAARLAELNARVEKARLQYDAFETSLYGAHPELKLQRGQAPHLTQERLGELLPDDKTALLEFVVSDEKSYLFVLTRGAGRGRRAGVELKTYQLSVKGRELADRVRDFRRRLAERDPEFREAARQLYDLLLKPASEQLRARNALCIIPDGVLWELPFQALQPREGGYLIEDYSLFYAPSLGVLYGIKSLQGKKGATPTPYIKAGPVPRERASARAPTLLAFGNPAIGRETVARVMSLNRDERLGPLPEAEREVKMLREIYKPANSRVYIGAQARERLAKAEMGDYRVLHFATHGVLDNLNPMYSHLVLSLSGEGEGEDGLLHVWEVMRLDLKADMVVLSACETARGRLGAGEGVVGMSWALFIAGSPTTVVSQWSVESSSTTQLMVEFHRNLLLPPAPRNSRRSKAEALRRASLSLLKDSRYAHPFYWAGFVMIGDGLRPL
jgi:CHAT domain-containing protein/tetratricopeptide (TPR) repeat protein